LAKPIIKIILSILSFACLLEMPYNYYMLYKFSMFLLLSIIAYLALKQRNFVDVVIALVGVIFFNPFEKVRFIKSTWQLIDEILAISLMVWAIVDFILFKFRKKNE
jgi:hypothetical protein